MVDCQHTAFEKSAKLQSSSAGRLFGRSVIYGKEDEAKTPYMTRYWIGRLRLHIFHRGDQDPDPHDHPWDFWTFPFTPYVEEVIEPIWDGDTYETRQQVVPAWHWTFRPAGHTHRVIGRYAGIDRGFKDTPGYDYVPLVTNGPIITVVWRSKDKRAWGFLKNRDGKWCWIGWQEYIKGGKSAPCE